MGQWKRPRPERYVNTWLETRYEPLQEDTKLHISLTATRTSARLATAVGLAVIGCAILLGIGAVIYKDVITGLLAFSGGTSVGIEILDRWRRRYDMDFYIQFLRSVLLAHDTPTVHEDSRPMHRHLELQREIL